MFSVVIPLYNKAQTITGTLSTVLKQTFKEFEIVIVNDGSTDKSVQLIRDFTADSRIRIIDQENQGVSVARNTGVFKATYEHIAFLDADDEWFPEYLEKIKNAIDLFPQSEMFCSAGMGKSAKGVYKERVINKYKNQVLLFDFFENPHVFLHISATVVTKTLFNQVNGFPVGMKRNEDFAFLYSAALYTQPVYSGYPLSVYVSGVEGQATNTSIYDSPKLLNDVVTRYNIVFDNWMKGAANNSSFIVFMKYELRHSLMVNSINKEFETNLYFLENLDSLIVNNFTKLEKFLMVTKRLQYVYVFFIKLTKLRWRLRGFQWVK